MALHPFRWSREQNSEPCPAPRHSTYTRTRDDAIHFRNAYHLLPSPVRTQRRYIIAADINPIFSGLGCMIRTLAPCWAYAVATSRTLVIDWRGNPYTRCDPEFNLFPSLFEPIQIEQSGIPVIADQSVNSLRYPQPLLTTNAVMKLEDGTTARMPNGGLDHDTLASVIANCIDVKCPTVLPSLPSVFRITRHWVAPSEVRLTNESLSRCYQMLKPRPGWQRQAEEFQHAWMNDRPVIGLHIRHGNGEGNFRPHFKHREISDFRTFIDCVAQVVKEYGAQRFGGHYAVFVATDSNLVVRCLGERLPGLITRSIWRPAEGAGIDFDHAYQKGIERGIQAAADALIDMLILARCDAVMLTRFTSFAYHVRYTMEKRDADFIDDESFANLIAQLKTDS